MDKTNSQDETWESKLIDYTLGMMEPAEAEAFAAGLAECRLHVQLASQYEQTMTWMGAAAQPAEPPSGHKDRLLSRVRATPQVRMDAAQASIEPATATSSAMLGELPPRGMATRSDSLAKTASVSEPVVLDLAKARDRRRNAFVGAIAAVAAALILLVGLSALLGRGDRLVIPSGYQVVQLAPQPGFDAASAVVLYDPTKNEATLLATGFPQVPAGKVYELWVLPPSGAPVQAGTFVTNSAGEGRHDATVPQSVGTYAGLAVTLEDAPGGDTPKGPFVAVGPLPARQ